MMDLDKSEVLADKTKALAARGSHPDYAAVPQAQGLVANRDCSMLRNGWIPMFLVAFASTATATLSSQLMPVLGADFYNGWAGDPCAGYLRARTEHCQQVTSHYLTTSSHFVLLYSALLILTSPFAGRFADAYGRWPVLAASAVLIGLNLAALAAFYERSVPISAFWWTYALTGLVPGSMVFMLWITDRTDMYTRVSMLGVLSAVSDGDGILMTFVGSMLSQGGCVQVMLLIFALVLVPSLYFLPESLPPDKRRPVLDSCICSAVVKPLELLHRRVNWYMVLYSICYHGAAAYQAANYQVFLKESFGVDRQEYLRLLTVYSMGCFVSQVFLAGPLSRLIGFRRVFALGLTAGVVGFLLLAQAQSITTIWIASIFGGMHAILSPSFYAVLTSTIPSQQRGKVLGEFTALSTLAISLLVFALSQLHAFCAVPRFGLGRPLPALPFFVIAGLNLLGLVLLPAAWQDVEKAQAAAAAGSAPARNCL